MANVFERRRITCPIYHVNAYVVKYDDGSHVIKCPNKERCGDICPYVKDPAYKFPYRRAPEYEP